VIRPRIEVERTASEILRSNGCMTIPVDVEKVAQALGAQVHRRAFEDQVSGVLAIQQDEKHILINEAHHRNRQRFSIAHELGHLVLHDTKKDRLFIDTHLRVYQRVGAPSSSVYTSPGSVTSPEEEREANWFAASLLMPRALLEQAAVQHELTDEAGVAALATVFGVSEQAMSIRLQQLDLLTTDDEAIA